MPDSYQGFLPKPTPETRPYFEALRQRRLLIQRCLDCGHAYFYPRPFCPECFSFRVEWAEASGRGTLYSFVVNHRAAPGFVAPYVIAVVQLDEGPRMMTNLVGAGADPEAISCGAPVEVVFEDATSDLTLPKFRLRAS